LDETGKYQHFLVVTLYLKIKNVFDLSQESLVYQMESEAIHEISGLKKSRLGINPQAAFLC